ncbi:MAG: DUF1674 domain-containing protein [Rhodospirillales bacterium]
MAGKPETEQPDTATPEAGVDETAKAGKPGAAPAEVGGPKGPEPTRYGDWEQKGRCTDF